MENQNLETKIDITQNFKDRLSVEMILEIIKPWANQHIGRNDVRDFPAIYKDLATELSKRLIDEKETN